MRGSNPFRQFHSSCVLRQRTQLIDKLQSPPPTSINPYPSKKTLRHLNKTKNKPKPVGDWDIRQWNRAITTHMRTGHCDSALRVFNSMPRRSSVSYNAMISGYLSNGRLDLAREVFDQMPGRDLVSWNVMVSGYVRSKNLSEARHFFDKMPKRDVVSWNTMLSGYAQNGYVDAARWIFDSMPEKNEISWNGLLAAYVQNGRVDEACVLFESKENWELVSWNSLMAGFVKQRRLGDARRLFDRMPERDEISWNTMITGYAQNNYLAEAQRLFEVAPVKDVFTWTAMVSGFVQNGKVDEARIFFDAMPDKNTVSWNAMIAGYVQSKKMDTARELFEAMSCKNVASWNTMITGYAQIGEINHARNFFDMMPQRDCISWAAMIAGHAQSGYSEDALCLFLEMRISGERFNRSPFTSVLSICANLAYLELGKQLHGQLVKVGFEAGCFVGNALLVMYCKCGSVEEAYHAFEEITDRDVISWNTMIAGYARHGFGKDAILLFETMKTVGIRPDDITMVGVLSACSHTGLVEKGREYFYSMNQDYGIVPNSKHYTCMVDLLGRAGRLEEAQSLMRNMPCEPDAATWGALLGACRIHGKTELAEKAAEVIFELEPQNAGMYVLLSNLYAASGRWADVSRLRLKMRDIGVKKVTGYSWLEVQNKVHTFSVGDTFHPEMDRIYAYLEELELKLKEDGFIYSTKLVLHDVGEEEKEQMLKYHSEKLAVAYGILSIPAGRPIRVIKNLRVCEDCHNAIKHISKIIGRLIILRDNNRFHHFSGGSCSCGDYW